MIKDRDKIIVNLLRAIDKDWAVCDDSDEDDFMVLVNESRDVHKRLRPPKELVTELEEKGFIKIDEKRSSPKGSNREYWEIMGEKRPVPIVYMYTVTPKGRNLLGPPKIVAPRKLVKRE
ncbi:hypothetical protein [Hahella chejuensis]|uniref:hypothetical protein n=1 Tax=Hahella chejuensis TaxID=158327 RepID=UPI00059FAE52|nr:hypothetical protein [Hahella chejuensis]